MLDAIFQRLEPSLRLPLATVYSKAGSGVTVTTVTFKLACRLLLAANGRFLLSVAEATDMWLTQMEIKRTD